LKSNDSNQFGTYYSRKISELKSILKIIDKKGNNTENDDEFLTQLKEIYESKNDYIGDPNGFCALWSLWWTEIRIKYPDIPIKKLVKMLNKELINKSYKELIRNYSSYITNYRDKLLLRSDISINDLFQKQINVYSI
jgi:hypothetical protein